MGKKAVVLFLLGFALPFLARADDSSGPMVRHLDYVRYDAAAQNVEWGVSEGVLNRDGQFVPREGGSSTYSMHLETGMMTHDGEEGLLLSAGDAHDAFRAFQALSKLMAIYTDKWDGVGPTPDEQTDDDASPPRVALKPSAPAFKQRNRITRVRASAPKIEGTIPPPLSLH